MVESPYHLFFHNGLLFKYNNQTGLFKAENMNEAGAKVLNKGHFDALLAWLDPSRVLAAKAHEEIRQKLIMFYYNNGLREAEACADETFDRVAENIEEKKIMRVGNPQPYFLGFARNILKERLRQQSPLFNPQAQVRDPDTENDRTEKGDRQKCRERCIRNLPDQTYDRLLRYYQYKGYTKIAERGKLAEEMNMSLGTLRVFIHRVNKSLEACVEKCLKKP
jgi:DNA-directed RNA polymerase specialized sigma24 family protein